MDSLASTEMCHGMFRPLHSEWAMGILSGVVATKQVLCTDRGLKRVWMPSKTWHCIAHTVSDTESVSPCTRDISTSQTTDGLQANGCLSMVSMMIMLIELIARYTKECVSVQKMSGIDLERHGVCRCAVYIFWCITHPSNNIRRRYCTG